MLLKIVPLYPGRTPALESVTIYPPIWSFWPAFWPATRQVFKAKLAEPRTRQVWPASKDGERSWTRATVAGEELEPPPVGTSENLLMLRTLSSVSVPQKCSGLPSISLWVQIINAYIELNYKQSPRLDCFILHYPADLFLVSISASHPHPFLCHP